MGSKAAISAVFAIGVGVVTACGGIDEPDLFSPGGVSSSSGDAGNGSKDGGGSGVKLDSGGGGGGGGDAGSGGSDAGGGPVDSGGGGGGGARSVFCGNTTSSTTCTGSDICCVRDVSLGNGLDSFACDTESSCTGDALGDTVISCDDAHDCKGGNICCVVFVSGSPSYYSSVTCQPTCSDTADRIFCDPARGNDDCVNGGSCVESGSMPGYHVCSG